MRETLSLNWCCCPHYFSNQLHSINHNSWDRKVRFLGPSLPFSSPFSPSLPPLEGWGIIYVMAELQVRWNFILKDLIGLQVNGAPASERSGLGIGSPNMQYWRVCTVGEMRLFTKCSRDSRGSLEPEQPGLAFCVQKSECWERNAEQTERKQVAP